MIYERIFRSFFEFLSRVFFFFLKKMILPLALRLFKVLLKELRPGDHAVLFRVFIRGRDERERVGSKERQRVRKRLKKKKARSSLSNFTLSKLSYQSVCQTPKNILGTTPLNSPAGPCSLTTIEKIPGIDRWGCPALALAWASMRASSGECFFF